MFDRFNPPSMRLATWMLTITLGTENCAMFAGVGHDGTLR